MTTHSIIESAAEGIAQATVEHNVIAEALVLPAPDDDDADDDDEPDKKYKKEKAQKFIRLARKHVLPEFDTDRAPHRDYEDGSHLGYVRAHLREQG